MPDTNDTFRTPKKTAAIMSGLRLNFKTPFGHLHVMIVLDMKDNERELEIFAQIGKCGEMVAADTEAICRLSSVILRMDGRIELLIKQLRGIGTHLSNTGKETISVPDSLGRALALYLKTKKAYGAKAIMLGEVKVDDDVMNMQDEVVTDPSMPGSSGDQ